ncbi:putative signal transduction protein [Dethiosulfovibrio peptidovorans DSM 11002]|uniref:Signal transduction protein n=1 Tax=Dethiosulfovibrio peptidovorans DSM 11002 TaxID=469381 RepID=D2Z8M4_9BACT|nr:HDOD domain-containing protein [Dethiosulfovibrio peptidovorans]EFC91821.1 putative signal transduction protein [Dethiosulfovibrio peptidovorans DSM 11002]
MTLLRVDKLKEGMVVKVDVVAPSGRLLLPVGTNLEDKHVRLLKSWGVVEVEIEGEPQPESLPKLPPMPKEAMTKGASYLDHLYSLCGRGSPVLREMFRISTVRIMALIAEKGISVVPDISHMDDLDDPSRIKSLDLSISQLLGKQNKLFSFSETYRQIVEVLRSPRSSSAHIAQVVEKDTSLSAKLLRIVNSAYYGFPSKIGSIQRAVTVLGGRELTTLAIGVTAIRYFSGLSQNVIDMDRFWRNSVACGVFARLLAGEKHLLSDSHFFLSGLLRDIGLLLLLGECPDFMGKLLDRASSRKMSLPVCEREAFGFSHSFLGAALLSEWQVPPYLISTIKYKDNPLASDDVSESSILHVADVLSFAMGYGWSPIIPIPSLDQDAWDHLELSHNVLDTLTARANRQISEIVGSFID